MEDFIGVMAAIALFFCIIFGFIGLFNIPPDTKQVANHPSNCYSIHADWGDSVTVDDPDGHFTARFENGNDAINFMNKAGFKLCGSNK